MDFKWLLFRFEGRINRARYWLTTLAIACSMMFALFLLNAICSALGIPTGPLKIDIVGMSASIRDATPHPRRNCFRGSSSLS